MQPLQSETQASKLKQEGKTENFKIVSGEDSDSIFGDNLLMQGEQQETLNIFGPINMDEELDEEKDNEQFLNGGKEQTNMDEYDEEYDDEQEYDSEMDELSLKPQELPMETILEEESVFETERQKQ